MSVISSGKKETLSEDIKLNLQQLISTLEKYFSIDDKTEKYRLIFQASYLIEKTIFYTQLERGITRVAVYSYKDVDEKINPNLLTYLKSILTIPPHDDEFINKLFIIREYIVKEYKKLKK